MTANPTPKRRSPIPNFAGMEGERAPRDTHTIPKTGAKRMMKSGFTAASQLAGISHPKITRLVSRSAKRVSEEPPCSNPDQKSAAPKNNRKITRTRFLQRGELAEQEQRQKIQDRESADHKSHRLRHAIKIEPDCSAAKKKCEDHGERDRDGNTGQERAKCAAVSIRIASFGAQLSRVQEVATTKSVLHETEDHPDAGRGETPVPAHVFAEVAAHQRAEECAEIDPHVEDRKTGIGGARLLRDRDPRRLR